MKKRSYIGTKRDNTGHVPKCPDPYSGSLLTRDKSGGISAERLPGNVPLCPDGHVSDFTAVTKGDVRMYKGQRFVCSGTVQHTAKAGHVVDLITWDSHCAECGTPYSSSTNPRGDWPPVRRCAEHRGNGPVIGKPARRPFKLPKYSADARRSLAMLGLKP